MKQRLAPPDRVLLGCILMLLLVSIMMVSSASLSVAEARYGDPFHIIIHWLTYIPIGLATMYWISGVSNEWWRAMALPLMSLTTGLLVLVLIPGLGVEFNGARRWFSIFGLTLQPVELVKPAIVLYMSYYISTFPERLQRFATGLAPMLVVLMLTDTLLLFQPDFGSALLISSICFFLWFAGGVPLRHLLGLLLVSVPIIILALIAEPYRLQRLTSFVDPWSDPFGSGYQLVQSLIAFGSGGITGTGLGQGVQKLFYLPEVFTDFIGATLAEELGLIGTFALIILFAIMLGRGIWLALQDHQMFTCLLVLGCTLTIGLAFLINLGAAMGLLPTKGMPLPFVSYGGSALIGNCILIGLILSVQRHKPENMRRGARK